MRYIWFATPSFPPCCLNDQSFCLPGPPTPLFTFFAHSVNILCTICTMCKMHNASVLAQSILYIICALLTVRNVNKALLVQRCRAAPGSHLAHHSGRWLASIRGSLLSQNFKHTASKSRLSVARPGFIFHKTLLMNPLQIHFMQIEIRQQLIVGRNEIKL